MGRMTNAKPQLHNSMMEQMYRCGIQWQRRYGARFGCWHKEEIIRPGIELATGISVHKAVERNMRFKMENDGHLLHRKEVAQIARDSFEGVYQGGMMFTEEETVDVKKTLGGAIDQTVDLSWLHYDHLASHINPAAVEEKFVIELNGYPFDVAGQKDIREVDGTLRDTKTKGQSPPADAARSIQMGTYCMSEVVAKRGLPKIVVLDFLVKTKVAKYVRRDAVPDKTWLDPVMARIERAIKIIEAVKEGKEAFAPADPENWVCSKRYCGYASTCPYWSGR